MNEQHNIEIYPTWPDGYEGCWTWGTELASRSTQLLVAQKKAGAWKIYRKSYAATDGETVRQKLFTIWNNPQFFTEKGQVTFGQIFPGANKNDFPQPKSVEYVMEAIRTITHLMSPSCPIRYIITVNALKEGWDCPFAYILASLANKTSQVDVEQILGRILRLPHTSQHTQSALNMSYVLTSSNDFNNTVAHIVKGLNSAGFSDKDYRISYNQRGNGVIIIPPQKRRELAEEPPKLRVAAYCRVSTQEEQQVGSFDMQIHHFTKRIEANPQWELVEIYQDEGISATTVEKRLGFQKMIADAVDGKIDLILTKSISRFGRNIVDILENLRTLSALNPPVSVEFETEGITYTGDGRNNLLISLLAALAEMESQQKSEAIKAGIRWRMAEGIYKFSVQNTLGFYRDHFGRLVIEPTEARIVEYIYESCLEGATPAEIAAALTEQGIKSPMGNDLWSAGTVRSILRNEKYCGDALMQKTYTKDFRTHKSVKNTDLNMYFKENHHTAIIKKEDWIKVQKLLSERHSTAKRATLRRLSNHFVAYRVKDGLFKGYLIMDSRWSFMERQEFMKIVDEAQNTMK